MKDMDGKQAFLACVVTVMVGLLVFGGVQNGSKPPETVTITEVEAKDFKEAAQILDRNSLLIRTLTAEIQLAQRNLKDLQDQVEKDRAKVTDILSGLAVKHGIPKDKMGDYDLSADGNGFKLTRKKDVIK